MREVEIRIKIQQDGKSVLYADLFIDKKRHQSFGWHDLDDVRIAYPIGFEPTFEEIRLGVIEEMKVLSVKAFAKIETWVWAGEWDKAVGGLDIVKFVLEAVKEWSK